MEDNITGKFLQIVKVPVLRVNGKVAIFIVKPHKIGALLSMFQKPLDNFNIKHPVFLSEAHA